MPRNNRGSQQTSRQNRQRRIDFNEQHYWAGILADAKAGDFSNDTHHVQTIYENKLVLCNLRLEIEHRYDLVYGNVQTKPKSYLNWSSIEDKVSQNCHVWKLHVRLIRKAFFDDSIVRVFGPPNKTKKKPTNTTEGLDPDFTEHPQRKLNREQLQAIIDHVDKMHLDGKTPTNRKIQNFIRDEMNIEVSI
jgi:hypothetical protein